jgi:hypothetical protein
MVTDEPFGNQSANSKRYPCHLKIAVDGVKFATAFVQTVRERTSLITRLGLDRLKLPCYEASELAAVK